MKNLCLALLSVFVLITVSPAAGQSSRDDIAASNRQFEEWTKRLGAFVTGVRFDEADVQSFIRLYDDFTAIGNEHYDAGEEYVDFNAILHDAEYRSWAKSKNLDYDLWLRKTMRIIAVMMRTEIEANNAEEQSDMQAQLEELEKMKEHMGEEAYQQMKQAMTDGTLAMQGMEDAYRNLPVPTDAEKALLAKYAAQLMNLE